MSEIPENENREENIENNTEEIIDENKEETNPESVTEQTKAFSLGREVFEWVYTIGIALIIAFLIKSFVADIVKVDGRSMETTLHHEDRLIITKLGYKPEVKDIVILDSNYEKRQEYYENNNFSEIDKALKYNDVPERFKKRYYVKRIIAKEGQTVDIVGGKVLVDGKVLDEPYIDQITRITDPTVTYPVTVKKGYVFVMGDNRGNSTDSRSSSLGQVPVEAILGKAQLRIWPLDSIKLVK